MNNTSIIATVILITIVPALLALFFRLLLGKETTFLACYRTIWIVIAIVGTMIAVVYAVLFVGEAAFSGSWGIEKQG